MERFLTFLPSVLVIASIALITRVYLKWIIGRFDENAKSVQWHQQNKWKVFWLVGMPVQIVWAPTVEELIFRAPLVLAFSGMSSFAWYGILTSAVLFSLMHWSGKKIWMPEILLARAEGSHKSDDIGEEVERLHQEAGKKILVSRISHVIFALLAGISAGYYGILYQSIWVSVGIHAAWNLVMPVVVQLLLLVVMIFYVLLSLLWEDIKSLTRQQPPPL